MRKFVLSLAGIFAVFAIVSMGSGETSKAEVTKTKERIWSSLENRG